MAIQDFYIRPGLLGTGLGQAIGQRRMFNQQQDEQAQKEAQQAEQQAMMQDLQRRAFAGDQEAINQLAGFNMQGAISAQNRVGQLGAEQDKVKNRKTAEYIAKGYTLPEDQRAAYFEAGITNPELDIDEEDVPFFGDSRIAEAAVRQYAPDLADTVFAKPEETEFQQGTGDLTGYAFNPDTGAFSIAPEIKERLESAKQEPVLDAKTRQGINKDITQLTKDTKLIYNTAKDLEKLSSIKSGPASIAMVFKFMKALDPTSVVREGEFATAENSAGVPEAVRNIYNKVASGERLGDKQQKEFVDTAKKLANSAINSSEEEVGSFLDTFEDTLPKTFSEKVKGRLPKPFDMPEEVATSRYQGADLEAYNWAQANPNDPRAVQILTKLGANNGV